MKTSHPVPSPSRLAVLGLIVSSFSLQAGAPEIFELGGMYTYHYRDGRYADWGDLAREGARQAIEEVNASGMLGDDRIRLKPENTIDYHCWPDDAAAMAETLFKKNILVLTGADCSGPAVEMARVAEEYRIPVISNGANASALSATEEFPYFVRVVTPSEAYEGYLVDVAAHFGIRSVAHLYTTDAWGLGARDVIQEFGRRRGVDIALQFGFARDTPYEVIESHIAEVGRSNITAIMITGPTPDTVAAFKAIHALGMNRAGYSIFAAEMISADESPDAVNGSVGYFAPMTRLLPSKQLAHFHAALESRLGRVVDDHSKAFFYGALSYDHIFAVGHAIAAVKASEKTVTPEHLLSELRRVDFQGATGRVSIQPGTNDRAAMPIAIMNSHGYKEDGETVHFVPVGSVDPQTGMLTIDESKILWPGGTQSPPAKH